MHVQAMYPDYVRCPHAANHCHVNKCFGFNTALTP